MRRKQDWEKIKCPAPLTILEPLLLDKEEGCYEHSEEWVERRIREAGLGWVDGYAAASEDLITLRFLGRLLRDSGAPDAQGFQNWVEGVATLLHLLNKRYGEKEEESQAQEEDTEGRPSSVAQSVEALGQGQPARPAADENWWHYDG